MGIGADGLKTGFTREGGYGLVGSAIQTNLRLIVVVNGLKSAKERGDEAKRILDFGFRGFEARPLFEDGQIVGVAKTFGGSAGRVSLMVSRSADRCSQLWKSHRIALPQAGTKQYRAGVCAVHSDMLRLPVA